MKMEKMEVVIPAYNEEGRLPKVVEVLKTTKEIERIIVVDDGSTDETAKQARELGVTVLSHKENLGKGAALRTGIKEVKSNPFLIMDADLKNLKPDHVSVLISRFFGYGNYNVELKDRERKIKQKIKFFPKKEKGETVLVNGMIDRGKASNVTEKIEEAFSGIRIMDRKVWEAALEELSEDGYGVDYLIYSKAKKIGNVETETLAGLNHYSKTEKIGAIKGVAKHAKMYLQIVYELIANKISKIKKSPQ